MARKKKGSSDALVVQNAAKTLVANIRFASVDTPVKSIVVTSSVPNEGKTTVSHNLAVAIASGGKRCLLVECDMRRRSMADVIGAHARYGIYAVLSGQVELADAVVSTGQTNLSFLASEPHIPNPADLLSSRRFRHLASELEKLYDYVIFDTPPVGTFVDAAVLASIADATVLVVRDHYTKRAEVVAAYEQLKKADANLIGVVLNGCESESSEYYYAYYNKDGKRVRKSEDHVSSGPEMPAVRTAAEFAPVQSASRGASAKPSETAQFTAAAVASRAGHGTASPRPVEVRPTGQQTSSRFSRR